MEKGTYKLSEPERKQIQEDIEEIFSEIISEYSGRKRLRLPMTFRSTLSTKVANYIETKLELVRGPITFVVKKPEARRV